MRKSIFIPTIVAVLIHVSTGVAGSMFERRTVDGRRLYDVLMSERVPGYALDLIFRMFDYNEGRITNTSFAVLIDYGKPSTEKRLGLLNFKTGKVEWFYVAHGIRTGVVESRRFSNVLNSWKSSLGFYYAKDTYISPKNGLSMYLHGVDLSNDKSKERNIVLHGARYVSSEFILANGRLGWSEGCPAVGMKESEYLIKILQNGSILFAYHPALMVAARQTPDEQSLGGEEIIPPGANLDRTPGEGGAEPPSGPVPDVFGPRPLLDNLYY
ncbi:murein L,D-transpeptidase catalytic domain family protein [Bdellovibrio sp.]|uniref:murein L,D-transpeptidase catalytic domain family protein n=1 Tax=Bdellovibrio sp. TaxID=28201 RepID=UPI0039E65522